MAFYKCPKVKNKPELVSWATGTDAELKAMVDAYYDGVLTLDEIKSVWSVGDERSVNLSAMTAYGGSETHVAQAVTFVIMNWGGKELSDNTTCLAVVGQKDCLKELGYIGPITNGNVYSGGWKNSPRRSWCNSRYKNSIPADFRNIFKQHQNKSGKGDDSTSGVDITIDYFALPSQAEVMQGRSKAVADEGYTGFEYYSSRSNRVKRKGTGSNTDYWNRSPVSGASEGYCVVSSSGSATYAATNSNLGLAPFGCI